MKYPGIEDYSRALLDLDTQLFDVLVYTVCDLRNSYWVTVDLLQKNWEKLAAPRTSEAAAAVMF